MALEQINSNETNEQDVVKVPSLKELQQKNDEIMNKISNLLENEDFTKDFDSNDIEDKLMEDNKDLPAEIRELAEQQNTEYQVIQFMHRVLQDYPDCDLANSIFTKTNIINNKREQIWSQEELVGLLSSSQPYVIMDTVARSTNISDNKRESQHYSLSGLVPINKDLEASEVKTFELSNKQFKDQTDISLIKAFLSHKSVEGAFLTTNSTFIEWGKRSQEFSSQGKISNKPIVLSDVHIERKRDSYIVIYKEYN